MLAALRAPRSALQTLEDRLVDAVAVAARRDEVMLVQRRARAWIDLNRAEDERDPRVDAGAGPVAEPSPKLRSGLGLVPRRAAGTGELWRGRFSGAAIEARIAADHRPYHAALAAALAAQRARHGTAVLLDLHSMPPLGPRRARIVIGDRFGASAAARFTRRVQAEAEALGLPCELNAPYAGGHIVERHGRPAGNVHALQLELDRSLYLNARGEAAGAGFGKAVALVRRVLAALADEASATSLPHAAE